MRTAKEPTHRTRRSAVDPYCVQSITWTRDELLAARGMTPSPTRRRPTSASRPAKRPTKRHAA